MGLVALDCLSVKPFKDTPKRTLQSLVGVIRKTLELGLVPLDCRVSTSTMFQLSLGGLRCK